MIPLSPISGLPAFELSTVLNVMVGFLFSMLRIGAFIIASPLFGGRFIPLPVRIIVASALAAAVYGTFDMPDIGFVASLAIVPHILTELVIGIAAGLILTIVFASAAIAGDRIASTAGLGFAMHMDPQAGGQTPVVSQIFSFFLIAIFLVTDGHLIVLRIIFDSYEAVPPFSNVPLWQIIEAGFSASSQMFAISVQLMMPAIIILLIVNFMIGVLTRSAPQLNIFSFGFPLTLLITIFIFYLIAPVLARAFEFVVDQGIQGIQSMMELL